MDSLVLFTANTQRKDSVEVIEFCGKIWINQRHLQEKLDIANLSVRTQYYSDEFKKMRCDIQECDKYQPCRMFTENTLAVEITMNAVKTQAVIFRSKFGVNQHDKVLRKHQSLGLRLKKLFPNEDIIEEYSALHCRTDFTFKKRMLVVQIDEKGHTERPLNFERKRQKELEKLGYYFIRINPNKPGFNDYEEFHRIGGYIAESIKIQAEESLVDDVLKRLQELEFKSSHSIKSKCFKQIVKKKYCQITKNEKHNQKKKKPIKIEKEIGTTCYLWCEDYTYSFKPQEVKMANKVPEKNQTVLFVDLVNQDF